MIRWLAYFFFLLILIPCLSSAKTNATPHGTITDRHSGVIDLYALAVDTNNKKKQEQDDKKKIKEVTKAKRLPKPEKLDEDGDPNSPPKAKPKRQRRPPGLERPPEIPRRNIN